MWVNMKYKLVFNFLCLKKSKRRTCMGHICGWNQSHCKLCLNGHLTSLTPPVTIILCFLRYSFLDTALLKPHSKCSNGNCFCFLLWILFCLWPDSKCSYGNFVFLWILLILSTCNHILYKNYIFQHFRILLIYLNCTGASVTRTPLLIVLCV